MSLRECINNAVRDGEIDDARASRIREILEEEEAQARLELGDAAAETVAPKRALDRFEAEAREMARRKRLMMQRASGNRARILSRKNGNREFDPGAALPDFVEHFGTTPEPSVKGRYQVVRGLHHARMAEAIFRFKRDLLGRTRDLDGQDDLGRYLFDEAPSADESIRAIGEAWKDAASSLLGRRNAAGGSTPTLENWRLPQSHNSRLVKKVDTDEYVDFYLGRSDEESLLDRSAMIDKNTGRPITREALREALVDMHRAIETRNWSRQEPGFGGYGASLGRQRLDPRFLKFKNWDAYKTHLERFGDGDIFSVMMSHIDEMSREIAMMEILGPNPSAMMRFLEQVATKEAAEGRAQARTLFDRVTTRGTFGLVGKNPEGVQAKVQADISLMRRMANLFTGAAYSPTDSKFARVVGSIVNLKTSAALGSAQLSAVGDVTFQKIARSFNGMPEAGVIRSTTAMMNPANLADRKLAVRSGLIAEDAVQLMSGQLRYMDEFASHEFTRRIADAVLRASGLSPWTQAGKWAFGMETFGFVSDNANRSWRNLNKEFRAFFERYGMGEEDWNIIRGARRVDEGPAGNGFITPESVAEVRGGIDARTAEAVSERYLNAVLQETEYAIPSVSLRGSAYFMPEGVRPGTLIHALLRSATMFKSFAVTVFLQHSARGGDQLARAGALMGARYLAKLGIYTTLAGALAVHLKDISKGRDPRPMDNAEFWGAALMQGGGLGIFGDFLFSGTNRVGGGLPTTVAGPLIGTGGDAIDLTVGNALQLGQGEETNFGGELSQFLRQNTPGASLWYLRLAGDRLLFDELQSLTDPDAQDRFRRLQRRYARDYGQEFWWAPGEAAPERPPNLTNALTGRTD